MDISGRLPIGAHGDGCCARNSSRRASSQMSMLSSRALSSLLPAGRATMKSVFDTLPAALAQALRVFLGRVATHRRKRSSQDDRVFERARSAAIVVRRAFANHRTASSQRANNSAAFGAAMKTCRTHRVGCRLRAVPEASSRSHPATRPPRTARCAPVTRGISMFAVHALARARCALRTRRMGVGDHDTARQQVIDDALVAGLREEMIARDLAAGAALRIGHGILRTDRCRRTGREHLRVLRRACDAERVEESRKRRARLWSMIRFSYLSRSFRSSLRRGAVALVGTALHVGSSSEPYRSATDATNRSRSGLRSALAEPVDTLRAATQKWKIACTR